MSPLIALAERLSLREVGYTGAGVWIRIRHRFGARNSEWFQAGHLIALGVVFLLPSQTFNQPAFAGFQALVPSENFLGWFMLLAGCVRVLGLAINGALKEVTPQIRVYSAMAGCLIWTGMSYCFWTSDVVSTWVAIYPLFVVKELVNIKRAAYDQGEAKNGSVGTA